MAASSKSVDAGASLIATSTALANIQAQRESMKLEQAQLEIPLLESAIETITAKGGELIQMVEELKATLIHPAAIEHLGNLAIVLQNVPGILTLVVNEHKGVLSPQTIDASPIIPQPVMPAVIAPPAE